MNYTLHQLKIFTKVCEFQSITKASEDLYLTQPAVSIQIKKLQDQFEIPLIEVVGKKTYVTDFGWDIYNISKKLLEESELIENAISKYKGLIVGKLKFSIVSTAKYILPYYLKGFVNSFPEIDIKVNVTNRSSVWEDIYQNKTDFAMVSILNEEAPIEKIKLLDNALFMMASTNEDIETIKKKLLKSDKATLLFRESGSGIKEKMDGFLSDSNMKNFRRMELVSNEAIKQSVLAGIGYSLMPIIGLKYELMDKKVQIVPLKGLPINSTWHIVYNKDKMLSPAAKEFIKYLDKTKEQINEENFGWCKSYH